MNENLQKHILFAIKRIVLPFAALAILGGVAVEVYEGRLLKAETSKAARDEPKPIGARRVACLGRLEPEGKILRLHAPSTNESSCVQELMVKEGDLIKTGDLIAIMDTHARKQAAVREAEGNVEVARSRLAQAEAGAKQGDIEAATAATHQALEKEKHAKKEFDRLSTLVNRNAIGIEKFELSEWEYANAKQEVLRTQGLLNSVKEIRETDLALYRSQVALAEAQLETAKANLRASEVRSPAFSTVLKVNTHAGERPGESGIVEIGNVQSMQAVAEVFEGDLQHLKVGQTARIEVDSCGLVLHGTVREVGLMVARKSVLTNDPTSDTDARIVEVRIDLNAEDIQKAARLSNARTIIEIDVEVEARADLKADMKTSTVRTR